MRKIFFAILFFAVCINCSQAQQQGFRKLKPAEISFLNNMHQTLYDAIPHVYNDWKPDGDNKEFDATKFWCPDPSEYTKCSGDCPVTLGRTDPYSLSLRQSFKMPDEQSGALMGAAYKDITDYTNASQIAKALKLTAKSKVSITIMTNMNAGDAMFTSSEFGISYCPKTVPTNIQLPVTATLAVKGLCTADCPILDEQSKTVSMSGNYYDNALIFLGKPVTKKQQNKYDDGLVDTRYAIGFDQANIGKLITQNIVIKIIGDSADIDAIINAIDWQKLYALIGK